MTDWQRDWPPERLAETAGTGSAEYLEPSMAVRLVGLDEPVQLQPRTIIEVGGLFLVETVAEPDNWYMGQSRHDGVIECWGAYGALEAALRGL